MMRVRTQKEMDTLVEQAGFDKCHQVINDFGIFTISLAVRKQHGRFRTHAVQRQPQETGAVLAGVIGTVFFPQLWAGESVHGHTS